MYRYPPCWVTQMVADFKAFRDLERAGWADPRRACGYVELFASASDQAIGSLLDAVNAGPQMKALDLCCGQGNASEALARRGCDVTGVDFSRDAVVCKSSRTERDVYRGRCARIA